MREARRAVGVVGRRPTPVIGGPPSNPVRTVSGTLTSIPGPENSSASWTTAPQGSDSGSVTSNGTVFSSAPKAASFG